MTTVLVIAGWDRSGSTILAEALGTATGVVSIGEVVNLWQRGMTDDRPCSCGEPFSRCPFWQDVTGRAFDAPISEIAARALAAQRRLGNLWLLLTWLPGLGRWFRARADPYRRLLADLYRSVAAATGAGVIVDASKTPWHAAAASSLDGFDVRIVHLVRDPRGVAHSLRKHLAYDVDDTRPATMDRHSATFSTLVWAFRSSLVDRLSKRTGRVTTVRYEDFAGAPQTVVDAVLRFAGLPSGAVAVDESGEVALPTSHNVSGNPSRFTRGPVSIRLDDSWKTGLPERTGTAIGLAARPWLRRFGYPVETQAEAAAEPHGSEVAVEPVSVVIATRDRPDLLRRAVRSVLSQDLPAVVEVIVVFDQSEPDGDLVGDFPGAPLRIITNSRKPGLAGARNSGILSATGRWIAFCDDDDEWTPDKLRRQLQVAQRAPETWFIVGGISIRYGSQTIVRVPPLARLTLSAFIRSRVMEAHPSTFLIRRDAFDTNLELVDEELPGSYAEDYDLLIRAAREADVLAVRAPVALVRWHPDSYFGNRWHTIADALAYLVAKTPEFASDRRGLARIVGQRAFALAALAERRAATREAWSAIRLDPFGPRPYAALAVASGLVDAEWLVRKANATGRGF